MVVIVNVIGRSEKAVSIEMSGDRELIEAMLEQIKAMSGEPHYITVQ